MAFEARVVDDRAMTPASAMPKREMRFPRVPSSSGAVTIMATMKNSERKVNTICRLKGALPRQFFRLAGQAAVEEP